MLSEAGEVHLELVSRAAAGYARHPALLPV
jgi:hypothetical protein